MKNNDRTKKGKISLTGSLASLAKDVQKDEPKSVINVNNIETVEKKSFSEKLITEDNLNNVINLAISLRVNPPKLATVYLYENVKKDVEVLKRIDGLENVPLAAILSAIIEDFLQSNTNKIKDLLNNSSSRF